MEFIASVHVVVLSFLPIPICNAILLSRVYPSKDHSFQNPAITFSSVAISTEVVHTDVGTLNGGLGGTETETDILVPAAALGGLLGGSLGLGVKEDVRLLLESALRLDGQLGGHYCGVVRRGSGVEDRAGCRLSKMGKIRCRGTD